MPIARHVRVMGRVQGVFFRAWTHEQARSLDVSGWVRNCSDGSVEARLEGEEHAVEQLLRLMRDGPTRASVDGLEVEKIEPEGLRGFEVRH